MNNLELYINSKLCDITSFENLGIRLNRVLLNPAELNTKDAQYSYSITIPTTSRNDEIFGYANIEEIKDKFNYEYPALLYVNSILVFDGKFRLSEIDKDGKYKGNLLVPVQKTIKELFGDTPMNKLNVTWEKVFENFVSSINNYNTHVDIPDCIFPYVLYGLLPKVPNTTDGDYSKNDVWDDTVRVGVEDLPPSINCLRTISKMFESLKDEEGNPYSISGTAFDDPRLKNLYMSYSNASDYDQEWNWGELGQMYLEGNWTNWRGYSTIGPLGSTTYFTTSIEEKVFNNDLNRISFATNLFNSTMTNITKILDKGANITHSNVINSATGKKDSNTSIRIPKSGFYKVSLAVEMKLHGDKNATYAHVKNGHSSTIISSNFGGANNAISHRAHEVKLIRDFGTGDFGMENMTLDANYYTTNLKQNKNLTPVYEKIDGIDVLKNGDDFPKYFPVPGNQCVQFIDPSVNEKLVGGFRWGNYNGSDDVFPVDIYKKVKTLAYHEYLGRILAIRSAWSWDITFSQTEKIYSIINNTHEIPVLDSAGNPTDDMAITGYWKYGYPIDEDESPELEPETEDTEEAQPEPKEQINVYPSSKFKQKLFDTECVLGDIEPGNYVETDPSLLAGKGRMHQIIWLNKGELLTLVTVSDAGIKRSGNGKGPETWMRQDLNFKLEIIPFQTKVEWSKVNVYNQTTEAVDWKAESDFMKKNIDLIKFLPAGQNADSWLDNFCKAFNLELIQNDKNNFELNLKQKTIKINPEAVVNLDNKASVTKRSNKPLGLPAVFDIGFKVKEEDEGYVRSNKDKGGGKIITGSLDNNEVTQTSNFSYNWFKNITHKNGVLSLPVISNSEIWEPTADYKEMMSKVYTDYPQRFWYRKGTDVYDVGAVWDSIKGVTVSDDKKQTLKIPQLSNIYDGDSYLDLSYKNADNTILRTYFNVIETNDSNYTEVECFLSPEEYNQLDGYMLVKFNGDLYYIASVDSYDPLGLEKTKLKLIRKI